MVEADRVEILQGEVTDILVPSLSGKSQRITRCPKCQTAVWSYYLVMGGIGELVRFVRVGTLDDPSEMPPDVHIYTSSKQSWVTLSPDTLVVDEYYKTKEVWSRDSLERWAALVASVQD